MKQVTQEMLDKLDLANFICSKCARKYGGKWPKGHVATMHTGECNICKRITTLANVGDWDWPDRQYRGMRD